jgi:CHAT domain-containing protein/Tfp pilus assembly protein PilF
MGSCRAQPADLNAMLNQFNEYFAAGDYPAALVEAQKMERLAKARFGANHINYAVALNNLANVNAQLGKYADAEGLLLRSLAIAEKTLGASHPAVGQTLHNLGNVYQEQGKYADAERLYLRARAIREKALGRDHPDVAQTLNGLANVYEDEGKYAEAEALHQRALTIRERALGPDHRDVAETLNNLAILYHDQGKYADAERLHQRALTIEEKALGASHPDVARSLNNLATLYNDEGKYADAEGVLKRALAVGEKALGADHPYVAQTLNNLAVGYEAQGRDAEAEALHRRALAIRERALGRDHLEVAQTLNNLGNLSKTKRPAEAEGFFKRALAIYERALGPDHSEVATTLNNLSGVYTWEGKYPEAEEVLKRALAIEQKVRGTDHPDVAHVLYGLALLGATDGDSKSALAYSRMVTAAVISHADAETSSARQKEGVGGLIENRAIFFALHLHNLSVAVEKRLEPEAALGREGFAIAQWANQSIAAAAVQQMALRFASTDGALASLVRERQDLAAFSAERDKALVEALSKPDGQRNQVLIDNIRRQIGETGSRLAANAARLEREFPDYAALARPKPLEVEEAQKLLGADEALVFLLSGEGESYVFALTNDAFDWKTIPLGAEAVSQKVAAFRRGLEVDAVSRGLTRLECNEDEAKKRGLSRADCDAMLAGKPGLFDLGRAYELYQTLLGPVEGMVKGKRYLLIVPSGALTALPFHLLVTEKPKMATPQLEDAVTAATFAPYREAAWLIKRQAETVLPSVASLKALRVFARKDQATKPMVGFGDPVFNPEAERGSAGAQTAQARGVVTRSYTAFWKGVSIDRGELANALPRLPDTADELKKVAATLGAGADDIYLREAASESTVKRMALSDYRVVYFATHGLVAGEVKGLAEPSLALTLPRQPSEADDGLLTASEIAQLKLNADWVVLSACNTVAGDKPGAEALSGLARAFFYAGARALLVSHWAVDSRAATRLTTTTFDRLRADPKLGRAEALRGAMLAYLADTSTPINAYPALWAPFEIVGEGAVK